MFLAIAGMHSEQIENESSRVSFSGDLSNYRILRLFLKESLVFILYFTPLTGLKSAAFYENYGCVIEWAMVIWE